MTKKNALEEIRRGKDEYCNTVYFDRFLRKIEHTDELTLIETLFGSNEEYLDTYGGYKPQRHGPSVIEYEEEHGYDIKAIWLWYCENFEKAWRWMFPIHKLEETSEVNKNEM